MYDFIDIKIAEDTILQPDVVIACKDIEKAFLDFAPSIVVEILSASTALKDRNSKFYLYEAFKIPYYIIVDIEKKEIEIYFLQDTGIYMLQNFPPAEAFYFKLDESCPVEVVLNNIWE